LRPPPFLRSLAGAWVALLLVLPWGGPSVLAGTTSSASPGPLLAFPEERLLAATGQPLEAASRLEKGARAGDDEALYLAGVYRQAGGDRGGALKAFSAVWDGGGELAPRALYRLHQLRGGSIPSALWMQPGAFRPALMLEEARRRLTLGEAPQVLELLELLLTGPVAPELRSQARVLLVQALLASGQTLEAQQLAAELLWCQEPRGLELLEKDAPEYAKVLRRLQTLQGLETSPGATRGLDEPALRLARAVRLMEGKEGRPRALELLEGLETEAQGDEALTVAVRYFHGRCLEMLDRDMEALELFSTLTAWSWRLPFRTSLQCRMGRLALREGFPGKAEELFLGAVLGALRGENVAEAAWLLGWTRYLLGDAPGALQMMRLLRSRWFTGRRGPFEHYGPMAVYWEARLLEAQGRPTEALALWSSLALALPVSFYGVLAAARLPDPVGPLALGPPPGDWGLGSLVTLAPSPEDRLQAGPALTLWRLGILDEALEEVQDLLARGHFSPFLVQLRASLLLRLAPDPLALFRRDPGLMNAPWTGPARFWAEVLPLAHLEVVQQGVLEDRALVAAVIRFESAFKAGAVSRVGAGGLMQLKPGVAGHVASRCLGRRLAKNELRNPGSNVTLGTVFLRELLRRHGGNWLPALAAYNAGPGMCSSWLARFSGLDGDELLEQLTFPNTAAYVKKIVAVRDAYYSLYWPQLGQVWTRPGLARTLPVQLEPYLDEEGGGCD
jgi:hypothetical protein